MPHNGWWVGAGVLAVLLGVTAASPVIGRPFLRAAGAADAELFGPIGKLAGQNSLRNPRRTTATASALMIGLTLAFTVAILGSLGQGVGGQDQVEENFIGDYIVSSAFGEGYSPAITDRMAEIDGVDKVLRQRFGFGLFEGDSDDGLYIVATAPDTHLRVRPDHDLRRAPPTSPTAPCWSRRTGPKDHHVTIGDDLRDHGARPARRSGGSSASSRTTR